MTADSVLLQLDELLSDIAFAGLKNAQPVLLQRLDKLQKELDALGMVRGSQRCAAFAEALGAYRRGECRENPAADALCALEFYCKNALQNG